MYASHPLCVCCVSCLYVCSAGLLASTYIEVQEVQQVKESYDALLVRAWEHMLGFVTFCVGVASTTAGCG